VRHPADIAVFAAGRVAQRLMVALPLESFEVLEARLVLAFRTGGVVRQLIDARSNMILIIAASDLPPLS
jgi:hypothetical protein